ncbi:acyltransferase family protein [Alkalihalobacterium chitinilyticum]|uniref:Acyltransferase family protein n=1 Tax=Alkalihalobacterium chitinilyticum TaxID=2980103 RepID=A0ABT5VII1_9BACI|nr:acyltransferase family protein [Alkalihalobacterium chitinilyticum]MDE5414552.1 acyltransferase family protein [Alkalihalobacterium chitinilyticum]
MKKNHVNEIFFLRSIACLTIVLLHSIAWGTEYIRVLSKLPDFLLIILDSLNVFLYYGTPAFIFITAFILGYSYKDRTIDYKPFLLKRVKFILIPYLCMAVLYALPFLLISFEQFTLKVFLNALIGDFHAYFVLIIFQFYLMFILFKKWFDKHSAILVITSSLIINIIYLSIFNFSNPINFWFSEYIWERYYWIPFPGWIFYYSLAYYTGRHYQKVTNYINQYKYLVFSAPVITSVILLFLYHSEFITIHSSKRIDILFHTISIIALVLYLAMKMKRIPSAFMLISKYSYGIYLLHTLYMAALILVFSLTAVNLGIFTIVVLFFGSILASIYTIYLFNLFSFGKYIVGHVDITKTSIKTSTTPISSISKFIK